MTPLQKVQEMYAAFGRGDVGFILKCMAPNVTWSVDGPGGLPFFGERTGPAGVGKFFEDIGANLDIQQFSPEQFFAQDDTVIVLGKESGKGKTTGLPFAGHWAHVFTFKNGLVIKFREYCNSAAIAGVLKGCKTAAA